VSGLAGALAGALGRARAFVLEPPEGVPALASANRGERAPARDGEPALAAAPSTEVVVVGLAPRSGVSTVARGLGACLARPGQVVHVVAAGERRGVPPALAEALAPLPGASLVWDMGCALGSSHTEVARRADAVVLVAPPAAEPALAELVARALARRVGPVLLVPSRPRAPERWARRAAVCVPGSRLGAALAAGGRRPGGQLGAALAALAAIVEEGGPA
jgi:hypothetical protein